MLIISYNSYYGSSIIVLLAIIMDKYKYNIQLGWIAKLLHYIIGVKLYYYMLLTMLTTLIIMLIIAIAIISNDYNYR